MGIISEFRDFAMKGNVIDLAVGVIIGVAFGGVTKSMVDDVLMPPIGKLVGDLDFTNLYISLSDKVDKANADVLAKVATTHPAGVLAAFDSATRLPLAKAKELGPVIAYGNFITTLINFLIVSFCVFLVVKAMNIATKRFAKQQAAGAAPLTTDQQLLTEIRDSLKAKA